MTTRSYVWTRAVRPLAGITAALILIACEDAPRSESTAPTAAATAERANQAPPQKEAARDAAIVAAAVQAPASLKPAVVAAAPADLVVKRFVVTTAVEGREPVLAGAIQSDASRVFAFVELANPGAEPRSVRITFERKGTDTRVGHAVLEVPASSQRYRTWGTSRHVKDPGEWEAVLWNERNVELGRTSFVVTQGAPALPGRS